MTRSSTLRCAAGLLLVATLLLPGMAAAREVPSDRPAEPVFSLARLWAAFVQSLPDRWTAAIASAEGDNGWQLDPNGTPRQNGDNGWQIDPDG
jgi:hypothetical protein